MRPRIKSDEDGDVDEGGVKAAAAGCYFQRPVAVANKRYIPIVGERVHSRIIHHQRPAPAIVLAPVDKIQVDGRVFFRFGHVRRSEVAF